MTDRELYDAIERIRELERRVAALENVVAVRTEPSAPVNQGRDDPEYWQELQAELDELEASNPDVARARRALDTLSAPATAVCKTCGGSGRLMDSGPPDHWSAPCPDCGGGR